MRCITIDQQGWMTAAGYKKNLLLTDEDLNNRGALVQVVAIEAGDTIPNHYHQTSFEVYCVLQGTCCLVVNEEEIILEPGSLLLMEPGDVHSLINHGSQRFLLLVFKTNAGNADTFWSS